MIWIAFALMLRRCDAINLPLQNFKIALDLAGDYE